MYIYICSIYIYICIYIHIYISKTTKKSDSYTTIPNSDTPRATKCFQKTLLTSKPASMTQSAKIMIPPNQHNVLRLTPSNIKW